ncbi:glycosyltransferase [Maricaulis sp.]|uniref:glycosyltransferase n=1 Tax=Maricaulis sp. TaxID=1486257 RepID=UPI003A92F047
MKLLVMSHAADRTGAPRSALLLAREWAAMGLDVEILLRRDGVLRPAFEAVAPTAIYRGRPEFGPGDVLPLLRDYDPGMALKCLRNPDRPYCLSRNERRDAAALAARYRAWGAQAIYANTSHCADMIEPLGLDLPVLTHVREMAPSLRALDRRRRAHLLKGDGPVLAVSERGRADLAEIGVAASRLGVEPPAAAVPDLQALERQRDRVEQQFGLAPGDRLVVGAGTVGPRKGPDLFIESLGRAIETAPAGERIAGLWLGEGEWLDPCRDRIKVAGLGDAVSFPGAMADIAPVLYRADLLLCTSREDPYPRVVIEAALAGTPSVAFAATGGAEEFITRFDAGSLVPAFDTGAMAAAITTVLKRPHRCDAGLAARVAAERSVERSARRILDRLQMLTGEANATSADS